MCDVNERWPPIPISLLHRMLQRLLPDLWDRRTELKVKQTEVLVNLLVRNDAFAALPTGYGKSPMLYVLAKNIRHSLS